MLLETIPDFPLLSKTTSILPVAPGGMGSLGGDATVQPQLAFADAMIKFDFPSLVKVKV